MSDVLSSELTFEDLDAEVYAKWFLRLPLEAVESEFTPEEYKRFQERRELRLNAELDDLTNLKFDSPQVCSYDKILFKIAKKIYPKPLGSDGSFQKSSRFNYKNASAMQNRVVYLGQDKQCCAGELFHLDIQKYNYAKLLGRSAEETEYEFKFPEYKIYEYIVNLDNILVLTTESTYKALGIPDRVVKNEWFSLNDELEIPTSGQILATIARKRGYKGILYTSVRTQTSNNLVIFEENTGPLSFTLQKESDFDPVKFFEQ